MKIEFEISDETIDALRSPDSTTVASAAREIQERARRVAFNQLMAKPCECGHNLHWHGQDEGAETGSGPCDDCDCKAFKYATAEAAAA